MLNSSKKFPSTKHIYILDCQIRVEKTPIESQERQSNRKVGQVSYRISHFTTTASQLANRSKQKLASRHTCLRCIIQVRSSNDLQSKIKDVSSGGKFI
jgi:hypothetical protein